jgi:hypothetical protein
MVDPRLIVVRIRDCTFRKHFLSQTDSIRPPTTQRLQSIRDKSRSRRYFDYMLATIISRLLRNVGSAVPRCVPCSDVSSTNEFDICSFLQSPSALINFKRDDFFLHKLKLVPTVPELETHGFRQDSFAN